MPDAANQGLLAGRRVLVTAPRAAWDWPSPKRSRRPAPPSPWPTCWASACAPPRPAWRSAASPCCRWSWTYRSGLGAPLRAAGHRRPGRPHGLVNNAAVTDSGGRASDEIDIATWDRVMQVNVRGTWLMTNACLDALRASGRGAIVNLASDTPLWGAPRLLAYVASKSAILGMTRSLSRELGEARITVNAVAPGLTLVEATEYVPAKRHELYCAARDPARAVARRRMRRGGVRAVRLVRFMTGQTLAVNGGFVMH